MTDPKGHPATGKAGQEIKRAAQRYYEARDAFCQAEQDLRDARDAREAREARIQELLQATLPRVDG